MRKESFSNCNKIASKRLAYTVPGAVTLQCGRQAGKLCSNFDSIEIHFYSASLCNATNPLIGYPVNASL